MKFKKIISLILAQSVLLSMAGGAASVDAATANEKTFFSGFNYAQYEELSAVKTAADSGDYAAAKTELVKYYKQRNANGKALGFGISEADENYGMAVLPMRNILTGSYEFDMWQGEFRADSEGIYTDYEVDVTERVVAELNNGAVSFMLFAGDKKSNLVSIQSKETENAPKLVITFKQTVPSPSGTTELERSMEIAANADTYISSKNTGTTYGSATELLVYEDGTGSDSTGTESRRTYINFPLDEAKNLNIVSAKLFVSAAQEAGATGSTDVLVINVGDTIWDENKLTWALTRGSIYSYENADVPTWNASAPNADSEYHNVTARFWFGKPMAYEYLSYLENPEKYNAEHPYASMYPGEKFGDKLVDLMSAFASQMNYGYPRTLETGERLNRWVDIIDALLPTGVFDDRADDFYKIITFMQGDCAYLNGLDIASGKPWWSNWRIVANAGFFKATEYLCELNTHDTWRDKAEYNVEYTMDLLYNADMSFTEAGPSYAQWCAQLFGDCAIMADKAGNPMSDEFLLKLRYATRYAMNSFFPDGFDTNVGDSNYRDKMPEFKRLAEFLDDEVLNAYVNGDSTYAENKSAFYPESNSVYMRTGWNPQESTYVSFVNNPGDGHYHPDSNQVLMYAYGQPLLVDSGRYSYSTTNNIYDQLRTAAAHNTIEAVGVNMGAHSAAASDIVLADNGMFTFASSIQNGYSGVKHTRNVLFFKNNGSATLVEDYITGSASHTYRQNWHFMPSSNPSINGQSMNTLFKDKANVRIANADTAAQIRDGYFSADYGLVASSEYASFEKTGKEVKFTTALEPLKPGKSSTLSISDSVKDNSATAVKIYGTQYYIKNTDTASGEFGNAYTNGKAAFTGSIYNGIVEGSLLSVDGKDYIRASETLSSIGIRLAGTTTEIFGEELKPQTDTNAVKIYAPDTEKVMLNGAEIEFTKNGDYIYAVGISKASGVEAKVNFVDENGNAVADTITLTDVNKGYFYTYSAPESIDFNGSKYSLNKEESTLTAMIENGTVLTAVYTKMPFVGDNLITNGDFANGFTDWTNAANGGEFAGTLSTNATYIHGNGKAITNTASAGGGAASTLRRFIPVEAGKQYYLSFYAYNTGAAISNVAFMSAFVPVKGVSYGNFNNTTFMDYVTYGGQNSWSNEAQSAVKRTRDDMDYDKGMNHKEYVFTIPEGADHILISMFAWTDVGRLYFSDFEMYEIGEEEPQMSFTFDGETAKVENAQAECKIITAQYDAQGKLIKAEVAKESEIKITKDENTASASAYLWDGADTMEPVTSKIEHIYK